MVANLLVVVPRDGKRKGGHHIIGRFLREHALGLSARMVEVINNTSPVPPPMRERKLCIKAMEEMIVLAKEYIHTARPQVCPPTDALCSIADQVPSDIRLSPVRPVVR